MANETMAAYWADEAGPEWVANQEVFDHLLEPFGRAALDGLGLQTGESVLDVGCGFGTTAIEAAEIVGSSGRVVGIDISPAMVERATVRAAMRGLDNVGFLVADAQVHRFTRPVDTVVSRFGVMFFDDPVAAFANLHSVVRPGGRLSFVCWQSPDQNPWITAPVRAWAPYLPEPPAPIRADAPGPFAFADGDRVSAILAAAGWDDITVAAEHDDARMGGGRGVEGALEQALATSTGRALRGSLPPDRLDAAMDDLRALFAERLVEGDVVFPAAAWLVTARR